MTGQPAGWAAQWFPDLTDAVVHRPGKRDPRSQTNLPGPPPWTLSGCLFAPSMGSGQTSSDEQEGLQHTVVTGAQLLAPAGSDIESTDRIEVAGHLWEVEGDIGYWGASGVQVSLRRAKG